MTVPGNFGKVSLCSGEVSIALVVSLGGMRLEGHDVTNIEVALGDMKDCVDVLVGSCSRVDLHGTSFGSTTLARRIFCDTAA